VQYFGYFLYKSLFLLIIFLNLAATFFGKPRLFWGISTLLGQGIGLLLGMGMGPSQNSAPKAVLFLGIHARQAIQGAL
jgi:hypothetical protein